MQAAMNKAYLGDGCYVSFDGYALWLTTENGISAQSTICLEPGWIPKTKAVTIKEEGAASAGRKRRA
jgi:hypothetical protein